MRLIPPSVEIISTHNILEQLKTIEKIGRLCYKSENSVTTYSYRKFINNLIKRGHTSVLEHVSMTAKFICSRECSLQLVRHRIASHTQLSQRYCNYSKSKFGNEISFIKPVDFDNNWCDVSKNIILKNCINTEQDYFNLLKAGKNPEDARKCLGNSCSTEVITTLNFRSWLNFFELRSSNHAQLEIRTLSQSLEKQLGLNELLTEKNNNWKVTK
jgi:thymidylate synthase (FAD)